MRRYALLTLALTILSVILIGQVAQAQEMTVAKADTINLLDAKKVAEYLGVAKALQDSLKTKIAQIQKIVDEDKKVRDDTRAKFMAGEGRPSTETMQTMRTQGEERQKKIDALVGEIQNKLTEKQKEKFKNVMVPNLREIARAERGQWRGRSER